MIEGKVDGTMQVSDGGVRNGDAGDGLDGQERDSWFLKLE